MTPQRTTLLAMLFSVGEHVAELRSEIELAADTLTESDRIRFFDTLRSIETRNAELLLSLPLLGVTEH